MEPKELSKTNTREPFLSWDFMNNFTVRYGTFLGIFAIGIAFSILSRSFFTFNNMMNILLQSTSLIMVTIGMTIALILRGVDLTVGYVADLGALVSVSLLLGGHNPLVAILGGLAAGLIIGAINGVLIINGVPALVGTLGMMFIVQSLELITTGGGTPVMLFNLPTAQTKFFLFLGQGFLGPVPMQVILAAVMVLIIYLVMYHTKIGRYFHAIGGNVKTAFLSGINTKFYFALGFIISGLFSAVAGIMIATRTSVAQPEGSSYLLLDSFVAAYIGSITFRRGQMNIMGSVIGALMVSELTNGVTVLGLGVVYQYVFKGLLIFLAVMLARTRSAS